MFDFYLLTYGIDCNPSFPDHGSLWEHGHVSLLVEWPEAAAAGHRHSARISDRLCDPHALSLHGLVAAGLPRATRGHLVHLWRNPSVSDCPRHGLPKEERHFS